MSDFSHIDSNGAVRMVDVSQKKAGIRLAVAQGRIFLGRDTFDRLMGKKIAKGNV